MPVKFPFWLRLITTVECSLLEEVYSMQNQILQVVISTHHAEFAFAYCTNMEQILESRIWRSLTYTSTKPSNFAI